MGVLWLLGLVTLPAAAFGPKRFFLMQAIGMLVGVAVLAVWLITPIAIWQSFGMAWVVVWLIPTSLIIFASVAGHSALEGG